MILNLDELTSDIYLRMDYHYWIWRKNNKSSSKRTKLRLLLQKLENGNAIKKEDYDYYETEYIHIVPRNIQKGEFVEIDLIFLKEEAGEKLRKYSVKNEDILLVISSNCGDCIYFSISDLPEHLREKQFTTSHYIVKIRVKNSVDAKILSYYKNYIKDYFRAVETGKTQKNLPLYYVFNIPISLSLLDKNKQNLLQTEISQIEQRISKLKTQIKETKLIVDEVFSEYFKVDMKQYSDLEKKHIFGRDLVSLSKSTQLKSSLKFHHPKFEFILKKLKEFKTVKLKQLLKEPVRRGVQPEYDEEGEILVIKTINISKEGFINLTETEFVSDDFYNKTKKKAGIQRGDILITSTGEGRGKIALYDLDEFAIADSHISIVRCKENVNVRYLTYFLLSSLGKNQLDILEQAVKGTPEIYPQEIEKLTIVYPSPEIQNKIVEDIETKLNEQRKITEQIEKLKQEIDSLIRKAILDEGSKNE